MRVIPFCVYLKVALEMSRGWEQALSMLVLFPLNTELPKFKVLSVGTLERSTAVSLN